MGSPRKSTKYLREKLYQFFTISLRELIHSFDKASITLIQKPDRDITRKLQINISHEHRYKNPQQKY